ncbi:MAG: DNA polymerase III subunit delta [Candidatus Omnitrophica bacterium]|nr:DNA polymerase III subunit delta [Candidatus Omnitrophota bacterium]
MAAKKPFLFLVTGEDFLRRTKIEALIDQLIPRELRSTNLTHVYADDLDWPSLLTQASTPSLMGGVQVFWIREAKEIKKSEIKPFEEYCARPVPECYFVFEAEEISETHPITKLTVRFGKRVHLGSQDKEEGFNMLRAKLKRHGKVLTPDAWTALEERLGAAPALMSMVLDQLMLYSDQSTIDEKQVEVLASEFLRYEPFDLTEALAEKDIDRALKIFHFFYDLTGDMTTMVGLIHWQLKRLWQAKRMLARGARSDEIGRALRIPPFRLHPFLAQTKRFEQANLEQLLESLWQLDWGSKKGASEETVAMEMFLATVGAG